MKKFVFPILAYPTIALSVDRDSDGNLLDLEAERFESESRWQKLTAADFSVAIRCGDTIDYVDLEAIIQDWMKERYADHIIEVKS